MLRTATYPDSHSTQPASPAVVHTHGSSRLTVEGTELDSTLAVLMKCTKRDKEMVGWHHRLNGHEFEQTLGDR